MTVEFKDIVNLIGVLVWPGVVLILLVVVLIILIVFRREIPRLAAGGLGGVKKVTVGPVSVEFAANQIKEELLSKDASLEAKFQELLRVELAQEAAKKFDSWITSVIHEKMADKESLLKWVADGRGASILSRDYDTFATTAQILSRMGYKTMPIPSKSEFDASASASTVMSVETDSSLDDFRKKLREITREKEQQ